MFTRDAVWQEASAPVLEKAAASGSLIMNSIIYAELAPGFHRMEDLDRALEPLPFKWEPLPREAGFLAGHCFRRYRQKGGTRRPPLPDFYIGAHAAVRQLVLVTRDPARYRGYFPRLSLMIPRRRGRNAQS